MQEIVNALLTHSTSVNYKKKEKLLDLGERSRRIYLLKSGVVRHYVIDKNGKDKTLQLSQKGDFFFSSIVSFYRSDPSYIICEALIDCDLSFWSKEEIDQMAEENNQIAKFRYSKLVDFILLKHQKELSLLCDSAEKRYEDFCSEFGSLFNSIPHYVIASYLNITPEMLSRLRKKAIS